jgi:sorbitol-specific phosphotransferase system component IIC
VGVGMANPRGVRCKKFAFLGLAIGVAFAAGYPFLPASLRWFTLGVFVGLFFGLAVSYIDLFWNMSKQTKQALGKQSTFLALAIGVAFATGYSFFPTSLRWFTFGILAGFFLCLVAIFSDLFWEKPKE